MFSNASNSIAETSDSAYNSDNSDTISVKGIENCAYFGAGTNKVAKILATFRNNVYLAASVIDMSLCTFRSKNVCSGYPGRIPRGVRLYRYCPIL